MGTCRTITAKKSMSSIDCQLLRKKTAEKTKKLIKQLKQQIKDRNTIHFSEYEKMENEWQ